METDVKAILLSLHSLQFYAAFTSVLAVFLTARKNILCWPIGILGTVLSGYVYFAQQLPFEALLQVVYVGMAVYGWVNWSKASPNRHLQVETTTLKEHLILISTALLLGLGLGTLSYSIYHSYSAYVDAMLTTFSIGANWLAAKRKIENWWYWIAIDLVSVVFYEWRGMHWFALLFGFFVVIAVRGLSSWKEEVEA
jgi:nicotinamide mononucleotide transporter